MNEVNYYQHGGTSYVHVSDFHAVQRERDEAVARADRDVIERNRVIAEKSRALAEAVELLREARMGVKNSAVQFGYPYTEYVDRIDAFLAKLEVKP